MENKAGGQENVALSLVAETPLCGMTGGSQSVNWGEVSRGNLPFPPKLPFSQALDQEFLQRNQVQESEAHVSLLSQDGRQDTAREGSGRSLLSHVWHPQASSG